MKIHANNRMPKVGDKWQYRSDINEEWQYTRIVVRFRDDGLMLSSNNWLWHVPQFMQAILDNKIRYVK